MEESKKAQRYIFWLTEYKNRRVWQNMYSNSEFLINFFYFTAHVDGSLFDVNFFSDKFFENLFSHIVGSRWRVTFDSEYVIKIYGSNIKYIIESMQQEIENLQNFLIANQDDFRFFMETRGATSSPTAIINLCQNNLLHEPRAVDLKFNPFRYRPSAFDVLDSNGEKVTPNPLISVVDGKLRLSNVVIDIHADLKDILADVAACVCMSRESIANQDTLNMPETVHAECILRHAKSLENDYTYSEKSDNARAVGLWLWEYVDERKCSVAEAVREARKQDFLIPLGYVNSSDRVLERTYEKTRDCIFNGKVLTMSPPTQKKNKDAV